MTLGQLGAHVANILWWDLVMIRDSGFDMSTALPPRPETPDTRAILDRFDALETEFRSAPDSADDTSLTDTWIFRNGDQVLFEMPRHRALRIMGISHQVHHRGQLTVYLRLLDIPVPTVFGPTADERGGL